MAKKAEKGKKERKKRKSTQKSIAYSIQGSSLTRQRKSCPKCGPGVYMAEHKDRAHCGKCGFAEFKQP